MTATTTARQLEITSELIAQAIDAMIGSEESMSKLRNEMKHKLNKGECFTEEDAANAVERVTLVLDYLINNTTQARNALPTAIRNSID